MISGMVLFQGSLASYTDPFPLFAIPFVSHKDKVRCRRSKDEDDPRCLNCRERNAECVFTAAGDQGQCQPV